MPSVRGLSIKQRLTWMSVLSSSTALVLACGALLGYERLTFRDSMVRNLSTHAQIIAANSAAAVLFNDARAASDTLSALRAEPHILSVHINSADGQTFATYVRADLGRAPPLPVFPSEAPSAHRFLNDRLVLLQQILSERQPIGTVYIQSDLGEMDARVRRYAGIAALVLLTSLLAGALLASMLQRRISQPILELVRVARRVSAEKDYSLRAVTGSQDELGIFARIFNEMLLQIERHNAELAAAHGSLERRVAERTAQLEIVNKELESFAYSVSHDLRGPLRALDGFSQAVLDNYVDKPIDERGRDYLQRIRRASQRMGQLIDDLLKLSRITRTDMKRQPVELGALVGRIVAGLREADPERTVAVEIAPGATVEGDPQFLEIALQNLLGNAWKFTSKQPLATIEFGATGEGGHRTYFVRDNGAGFDMAYAGRLFGAFQRLHSTSEFEGTGIGLAIVQRVISRHGGSIWAESEVGKGATFYFTLQEMET